MSQDLFDLYANLEARVRQLESKNQQRISLYASTTASKNTNLNNGAGVAIDWNGGVDTPGNVGTLFTHSTSSNPTRVTINRKATVRMRVNPTVSATVANSSLLFYFLINGATAIRGRASVHITNAGGHNEESCVLERVWTFNAGDYVEVCSILAAAAGTVTFFGTVSIFELEEVFQ